MYTTSDRVVRSLTGRLSPDTHGGGPSSVPRQMHVAVVLDVTVGSKSFDVEEFGCLGTALIT